ncbi:TnsA-like heteromeric transposase endonuclease subunit [Virgisporangium aurantiacum]|uniref:TnsA-like heteromeric transposase endonuclease subunit n=1 Tax=Virgisporangium aurantiacum TaxID=175570 RepID=A0A8J3ZJ03_9ACTN|nr:TnsA-like heteromeric transposase endonuclease subunit [Virgisporangium aurantiacum]GIJ64982.1 hypothetical protein Vau01_124980 [Virgisporangium aurantiacum]
MEELFVGLDLAVTPPAAGGVRGWTVAWRTNEGVVSCSVRDLGAMPLAVMRPVRRFAWSARQRHRPGLQFMVSTGRHHGFESLAEQRLLLALDFAGEVVVQVLGQPFRLRFTVGGQRRDHVPDVLAVTRCGVWLFDVRPADRVSVKDMAGFAAAARVATEVGWRYAVVTGWRPNVLAGVEALSAQRRPLDDPLGMQAQLLTAAAARPMRFSALATATSVPAIGRAHALHLLWHRRLEVDLSRPLGDATLVRTAAPVGPAVMAG